MRKLLLVGLILLPIQRESGSEPAPQELIHINQALREWLQLQPEDLQALYNVAAAGLPMLILPQGWDGEP